MPRARPGTPAPAPFRRTDSVRSRSLAGRARLGGRTSRIGLIPPDLVQKPAACRKRLTRHAVVENNLGWDIVGRKRIRRKSGDARSLATSSRNACMAWWSRAGQTPRPSRALGYRSPFRARISFFRARQLWPEGARPETFPLWNEPSPLPGTVRYCSSNCIFLSARCASARASGSFCRFS